MPRRTRPRITPDDLARGCVAIQIGQKSCTVGIHRAAIQVRHLQTLCYADGFTAAAE